MSHINQIEYAKDICQQDYYCANKTRIVSEWETFEIYNTIWCLICDTSGAINIISIDLEYFIHRLRILLIEYRIWKLMPDAPCCSDVNHILRFAEITKLVLRSSAGNDMCFPSGNLLFCFLDQCSLTNVITSKKNAHLLLQPFDNSEKCVALNRITKSIGSEIVCETSVITSFRLFNSLSHRSSFKCNTVEIAETQAKCNLITE